MFFNFSTSSSSSTTSTSSVSAPTNLEITSEDQRHNKDTLERMKGRKLHAYAMYMITKETIYRITMETAATAIKVLKKVIRKGVCHYIPGSKTDNLLIAYNKIYQEYEAMILKMEIKMIPTKAEFVIECWLKKDAALQAAQEYKAQKKQKKAARAASKAASIVTSVASTTITVATPTMKPRGQLKKSTTPSTFQLYPIEGDFSPIQSSSMRPIMIPALSPIASASSIPEAEPQYVNIRRHPAMGVKMARMTFNREYFV